MKREFNYPEPYAPLEQVEFSAWNAAGIAVFIKREDLSHPFISGNKWRKLKYHLKAAIQQNKSSLVTFGGAYSNHILATAAAGAKFGFQTRGIIRGEEVNNPVLNLAAIFGMKLHFISRSDYRDKEQLFQQEPDSYLIPEGGSGPKGEKGAGEVLNEINDTFTHVLCTVGTGATFSGLLQQAKLQNRKTSLEGFAIIKNGEYLQDMFAKCDYPNYSYHTDSHGGGYAKTNDELMAFIQTFAAQTGILCDQVYEAKMILHFTKLVQENYYPKGSKIAILHNGGLSGMLSMLNP